MKKDHVDQHCVSVRRPQGQPDLPWFVVGVLVELRQTIRSFFNVSRGEVVAVTFFMALGVIE